MSDTEEVVIEGKGPYRRCEDCNEPATIDYYAASSDQCLTLCSRCLRRQISGRRPGVAADLSREPAPTRVGGGS